MGDVVNLNQYRKQRDRQARKKQAAENRVKHGQRRPDRLSYERERARHEQELDSKRLHESVEPDDPPTPA
ncbi:MAG: DUF4169 family protein [Minwuiales bacterium]|nr:DUF4169 family protein [Minwuiales bacterium]